MAIGGLHCSIIVQSYFGFREKINQNNGAMLFTFKSSCHVWQRDQFRQMRSMTVLGDFSVVSPPTFNSSAGMLSNPGALFF